MTRTALALVALLACFATGATEEGGTAMGLTIRSDAFTHQGSIPSRYTCEGEDVSPALQWSGVPPKTRSLVLIVDAPDAAAPRMTWVHWVLYNPPGDSTGLKEAVKELPAGTREGVNDWKRTGYG